MVGHLKALSQGKRKRVRSTELEAEIKLILTLAKDHKLTIAWLWCKRDEPVMKVPAKCI